MNVAVIGAGISGLGAAYVLQREHRVTVFEQARRPGGHAQTREVERGGRTYPVDTGFVVYNETTYPSFVRLLELLGVDSRPTSMSFGVRCDATGLEYCGTSLNTVFAQRRNLLRPSFLRLLIDILRFNGRADRDLREASPTDTLGDYLSRGGYSEAFRAYYLGPLVAAIWSLDPARVHEFPLRFLVTFLSRHRLLRVRRQLRWRVVRGGSARYVERLVGALRDGVHTGATVRSVRRGTDQVEIAVDPDERLRFDHVVIATHSDQALHLLADPSEAEREVLGAIEYQANEGTLHTDTSLLPRNRRARANWNYRVPRRARGAPVTTYDMSGLQGLDSDVPLCITLNDSDAVDPDRTIYRQTYSHPVYTTAAIAAQRRWDAISGVRNTHYCGAYWGAGFHEDGLASALAVCRRFGLEL
jgi:predicted NAD/FAD-binding protein